jgi:hypothetical protein
LEIDMRAKPADLEKKIALFARFALLKGLSPQAHMELAELAALKPYAKHEVIFRSQEPCMAFTIVAEGLVRVSRYSATGKRLTYLLAGPGKGRPRFSGAILPIFDLKAKRMADGQHALLESGIGDDGPRETAEPATQEV